MKRIVLGSIVLFILLLIYYNLNPAKTSIFPKCPFLLLTGLKCPGCGSQRAIHCLLHFDVRQALEYNMLLVFSLPVIIVLGYIELERKKIPDLYMKMHNYKFIWGIFTVIISWWIGRNIFNI